MRCVSVCIVCKGAMCIYATFILCYRIRFILVYPLKTCKLRWIRFQTWQFLYRVDCLYSKVYDLPLPVHIRIRKNNKNLSINCQFECQNFLFYEPYNTVLISKKEWRCSVCVCMCVCIFTFPHRMRSNNTHWRDKSKINTNIFFILWDNIEHCTTGLCRRSRFIYLRFPSRF